MHPFSVVWLLFVHLWSPCCFVNLFEQQKAFAMEHCKEKNHRTGEQSTLLAHSFHWNRYLKDMFSQTLRWRCHTEQDYLSFDAFLESIPGPKSKQILRDSLYKAISWTWFSLTKTHLSIWCQPGKQDHKKPSAHLMNVAKAIWFPRLSFWQLIQ